MGRGGGDGVGGDGGGGSGDADADDGGFSDGSGSKDHVGEYWRTVHDKLDEWASLPRERPAAATVPPVAIANLLRLWAR